MISFLIIYQTKKIQIKMMNIFNIFNIFSLILLNTISHADDENCVWVRNNINTYGEHLAGMVTSRDECVHLVLTECPTATIANMAYDIDSYYGADCWCQYGTDMTEDSSSSYTNCLISSLSDGYIEELESIYGDEDESESTYTCSFFRLMLIWSGQESNQKASNSCEIGSSELESGRSYDDVKDETEFTVRDFDSTEEQVNSFNEMCCEDNIIKTIVIIVIIVIILLIISCICCCIYCCECCKPLRCCNNQQRPVQGIELQPVQQLQPPGHIQRLNYVGYAGTQG